METKKIVEDALTDVYENYKDRGLLSVYLYGSLLTEDFNPEMSDIDSIGIVDDELSLFVEDEIQ